MNESTKNGWYWKYKLIPAACLNNTTAFRLDFPGKAVVA